MALVPNGYGSSPFTSTLSSSGSAGANSLYASKVTLFRSATVTGVALNTLTPVVGNMRVLIYDGSPSALLASGAVVAMPSVSGYNFFPLSSATPLVAGTYYVGYCSSAGLNVSIDNTLAGSAWFISGGVNVNTPPNPISTGSSSNNGLSIALQLDSGALDYGFAPDHATEYSLNANKTRAIRVVGGFLSAARSVVTQATSPGGKFYAEIVVTGTLGITNIGLAGANCSLTGTGSIDASLLKIYEALRNSGSLFGTTTGSTSPTLSYVAGDSIGIAYDATQGRVWFRKNGGSWSGLGAAGDPVAGTNPIAVSPGNWPMMVFCSSDAATTFELRDTAGQFSYAIPSGYSAWSLGTGLLSGQQQSRVMVLA